MRIDYKKILSEMLPVGGSDLEKLCSLIAFRDIPSGTVLLSEGETASRLFMVVRGCLRTYFVKENGAEITTQFFIEKRMVSSFESAMTNTPSRIYIGAIEDSTVGMIGMKDLGDAIRQSAALRDHFNGYIISRLIRYMNQHASFILDSPEKRYVRLVKENPELVSRIPQQYIASYLGITPVSLSRIRARIKRLQPGLRR